MQNLKQSNDLSILADVYVDFFSDLSHFFLSLFLCSFLSIDEIFAKYPKKKKQKTKYFNDRRKKKKMSCFL